MSSQHNLVMLAGDHPSTYVIYNFLQTAGMKPRVLILEQPPGKIRLLARRAKRIGAVTALGQGLFVALAAPILRLEARGRIRTIIRENDLDLTPPPSRFIERVSSVNAPQTIGVLREIQPKVVVVNATRIISRTVLECVPATFINMHAGITPAYRGVHGAYWALVNSDPQGCGVTVHLVDPGIDSGPIISQARIHPTPQDNFASYPWLQLAAGLPLLKNAVQAALNDQLQTSTPTGPSKLWYHPSLWEYLLVRLRRGIR